MDSKPFVILWILLVPIHHIRVSIGPENPKNRDTLLTTIFLDQITYSTTSNNLNQFTDSFKCEPINEDSIRFEGSCSVQTERISMKFDEFANPVKGSPMPLSSFEERSIQMESEGHPVTVDKKVVSS